MIHKQLDILSHNDYDYYYFINISHKVKSFLNSMSESNNFKCIWWCQIIATLSSLLCHA